ncbi:30S ribosomal protein S12 methylthiotransferase RimO [bacterium]|nr:30S ribosomal protein S12 methylthiotransferase RimO [bacterium]
MGIKIYIKTLGCPKNEVDSVELASGLLRSGFDVIDNPDQAEILLVNTCSFIEEARLESSEAINDLIQLKSRSKGKKLGITGCWAEMERDELLKRFPDIDGVFGNKNIKQTITDVTNWYTANDRIVSLPDDYGMWHTQYNLPSTFPYAYVKISDGCDNMCSYCTLPYIKGRYRSMPSNYILDYISNLVDFGYKEIVLVGQDTSQYGIDIFGSSKLYWLLEEISKIKGDFWIRLMYVHPKHLTDEIIDVIYTNKKILPYLDIPIQHYSDNILRLMNRGVTGVQMRELVKTLKSRIPDLTLRTTLMVGFPGEDEKDFDELVSFVEEGWFDHLGVFVFSREKGTPAYDLPGQVDKETAIDRKELIEIIQNEVNKTKSRKLIGQIIPAIIESETLRKNVYNGRTIFDAPNIDRALKAMGSARIGEVVKVKIHEVFDYKLVGEIWEQ